MVNSKLIRFGTYVNFEKFTVIIQEPNPETVMIEAGAFKQLNDPKVASCTLKEIWSELGWMAGSETTKIYLKRRVIQIPCEGKPLSAIVPSENYQLDIKPDRWVGSFQQCERCEPLSSLLGFEKRTAPA